MKKTIYSLVLIFGLAFSMNLQAETTGEGKPTFTRLDTIVAVVNHDPITQSQLDKETERLTKQLEQTNQPLPSAGELRKQVLDALIAKSLQIQLAKSKNLAIKEEDINKAISHIAASNKLNTEQLKQAVEHSGLKYDEYKEQIHEQIMFQKLQQEEIGKNMSFSPKDVQDFIRANKDKLNRYNSFHVIDIVMPIAENATPAQVDSLKKQALSVQADLQKGTAIDEILKKYPYAQNNDLGWRAIGEFPSLFQARVAAMNVKSVSQPLQAPNGFHILQLLEAKGENARPSDKDLKNMAYQYKMNNAVKDWVKTLRQSAYVQIMKN